MINQRSREGYLLIDHTNSPGVSADFVYQSGLNAPVVGAGTSFESATMTCSHCNGVVILNPNRTRERGFCFKCNHYICDSPTCNRDCRPFRQLIDMTQERAFKELGNG